MELFKILYVNHDYETRDGLSSSLLELWANLFDHIGIEFDVKKDVVKQFGIKPVPASAEIFLITPELINILISLQWVGVKQNKKRILTKDPQLSLDLNQDV